MEFVKDDSEDMSDAEACRIKDEDGEEQRGWWSFFILSILLSWLTNEEQLSFHGHQVGFSTISVIAIDIENGINNFKHMKHQLK